MKSIQAYFLSVVFLVNASPVAAHSVYSLSIPGHLSIHLVEAGLVFAGLFALSQGLRIWHKKR